MKRILFAVAMLSILLEGCSGESPTSQQPLTGSPTAVGVSVGVRTEATIGPAGGELFSADSLVKLDVPAGALGNQTTISIEPLTNYAPGGMGRAYRLLPSGLEFS